MEVQVVLNVIPFIWEVLAADKLGSISLQKIYNNEHMQVLEKYQ
jgi:hypothetical protein